MSFPVSSCYPLNLLFPPRWFRLKSEQITQDVRVNVVQPFCGSEYCSTPDTKGRWTATWETIRNIFFPQQRPIYNSKPRAVKRLVNRYKLELATTSSVPHQEPVNNRIFYNRLTDKTRPGLGQNTAKVERVRGSQRASSKGEGWLGKEYSLLCK